MSVYKNLNNFVIGFSTMCQIVFSNFYFNLWLKEIIKFIFLFFYHPFVFFFPESFCISPRNKGKSPAREPRNEIHLGFHGILLGQVDRVDLIQGFVHEFLNFLLMHQPIMMRGNLHLSFIKSILFYFLYSLYGSETDSQ